MLDYNNCLESIQNQFRLFFWKMGNFFVAQSLETTSYFWCSGIFSRSIRLLKLWEQNLLKSLSKYQPRYHLPKSYGDKGREGGVPLFPNNEIESFATQTLPPRTLNLSTFPFSARRLRSEEDIKQNVGA